MGTYQGAPAQRAHHFELRAITLADVGKVVCRSEGVSGGTTEGIASSPTGGAVHVACVDSIDVRTSLEMCVQRKETVGAAADADAVDADAADAAEADAGRNSTVKKVPYSKQ